MVDYWKDVPGIDEASGSYPGILVRLHDPNLAFIFGTECGSKKIKTGSYENGIFVKSADLKKINTHILKMVKPNSTNGAFDFSTDEFINSGIRGVV
jgi:hypothetical protein